MPHIIRGYVGNEHLNDITIQFDFGKAIKLSRSMNAKLPFDEFPFLEAKVFAPFKVSAHLGYPFNLEDEQEKEYRESWRSGHIFEVSEERALMLEAISETNDGPFNDKYHYIVVSRYAFRIIVVEGYSGEEYASSLIRHTESISLRQIELEKAKEYWQLLGDIPLDADECIEHDFEIDEGIIFEAGSEKTEIWHWFEEQFNLSVHDDLMFPKKD